MKFQVSVRPLHKYLVSWEAGAAKVRQDTVPITGWLPEQVKGKSPTFGSHDLADAFPGHEPVPWPQPSTSSM